MSARRPGAVTLSSTRWTTSSGRPASAPGPPPRAGALLGRPRLGPQTGGALARFEKEADERRVVHVEGPHLVGLAHGGFEVAVLPAAPHGEAAVLAQPPGMPGRARD